MTITKKRVLPLIALAAICSAFVLAWAWDKSLSYEKLSVSSPTTIADAGCKSRLQYKAVVDYNKEISQAIKEGHYGSRQRIDPDDFPPESKLRGRHEVVFEVLQFNRSMQAEDVFREFDKRGLRPADLRELLAFGAQYRGTELYRDPIVALSALWVVWSEGCGNIAIVGLYFDSDGRELNAGSGLSGYIPECRFLAVKIK